MVRPLPRRSINPAVPNMELLLTLAMRPGSAKIIERLLNTSNFESIETDLHIAANACCIEYSNSCSSKRVHWLSNCHSLYLRTTYYRCEVTVEFDIWFASVRLLFYANSPASGMRIQNTAVTGHYLQNRMNGLSSTSPCKFWGYSYTGPYGSLKGIWLLYIRLTLSTMPCLIIWMAL